MTKIAVLTGNGLSVALSSEFSLPNITNKFFERLAIEHKAFIEHQMPQKNNYSDFEECIATVEKFYDTLHNYQNFYTNSSLGREFLNSYDIDLAELLKHENSIQTSIHTYMALILEIVNWNVKKHLIDSKLKSFVRWLSLIIREENEVELFTLNYDLLLETILIDSLGPHKFIEYYHQAGPWFAVSKEVPRYYFNPEKVKNQRHKQNCKVKLYHLHGSVSSFKDLKNNKIFKIKNEAIKSHDIYNRISELLIVPSIITGGRKNDKIKVAPFNFYYDQFVRKMSDAEQLCEELVIVGYSFRDEHLNSAIAKRIQLASLGIDSRPLKLLIIDYARYDDEKNAFISQVNSAFKLDENAELRFIENDSRISFEGANSIFHCY